MMPNNNNNGIAASDDASSGSGGSNGGSNGGHGSATLKKGPWTAAEDAILMDYVRKHGEGNWNAVQKNSGLSRCGKSCRLRWANHLRPNLKKGSFSPEEERLILELHAKLGNKWARMAAQLPGRTDNEIKNYWNTRVKRRQRAGLPLYPQDIQKQASSYHHHQTRPLQSGSSSSMQLSSHQSKSGFASPLSLFDPLNFPTTTPILNQQTHTPFLSMSNGFKRFRGSNGGGFSSLSSLSSHSSQPFSSRGPNLPSSQSLYTNQNFNSQLLPTSSFQFDTNNYNFTSPGMLTNCFDSGGLINPVSTFSVKTELPSCQNSQHDAPSLAQGNNTNEGKISPSLAKTNSGLLDALLQEAEAMGEREQAKREGYLHSQEHKYGELDEFLNHAPPSGSVFSDNAATPPLGSGSQWDDASSAQSSAGGEIKKEPAFDINNSVEDDDLSSLLNSIPSTMMVSELYNNEGAEASNGQSSVTEEDIGLDMQHLPSTTTIAATGSALDDDWSLGAWNNLPGMSC